MCCLNKITILVCAVHLFVRLFVCLFVCLKLCPSARIYNKLSTEPIIVPHPSYMERNRSRKITYCKNEENKSNVCIKRKETQGNLQNQ